GNPDTTTAQAPGVARELSPDAATFASTGHQSSRIRRPPHKILFDHTSCKRRHGGRGPRDGAGVMTVHKLTAGDGYTYLTRQVAKHDASDRGFSNLGEYYSAKGEAPGIW